MRLDLTSARLLCFFSTSVPDWFDLVLSETLGASEVNFLIDRTSNKLEGIV